MWDFEHNPTEELRRCFHVSYTVPSQCARQLQEGSADIGIVPVITTALIPGLVIVSDVAIAARGPVKSILLVSRKPIEDIRTVAVDTSSRTSVALTQVLLTKFFGGPRELVPMAPELGPMLNACDAALLIGDPALQAQTANLQVYDLAEVWKAKTGESFVFAVWAVRRDALTKSDPEINVASVFQRSRDRGLTDTSISEITRKWAPRLQLSPELVASYLRDNIHYKLDEGCLRGLRMYFELAAECELIPRAPALQML